MTARKGGKIGEADLPGRPLAGVQPDADRAAARAPEPRARPKSKRKAGQQAESIRARAGPARPPSQITRPIVLVVVGMHRSGTSALGYCLSRVGASLPVHLVGAGAANERGHWEPEKVIDLNDRYLAAAGSGWDDWRQFEAGTMAPNVKAAFVREIKATVKAEYPGQSLLMLKDPRISRMIPLYNEALRDAGYDPRYILCMRSPVEVVSSLSDRDGMSEAYARLLWLRHMLDAEYATRTLPRTVHQFDALLGDWRESLETISDELRINWPRSLDEAAEEIDSFLDRGLRHHWRGEESFVGPHADWLMRAWEGLHEADTRRGQTDLDAVRSEFNALSAEIGDQVVPEIYSRQQQVQREIALHRDNADSLAAMLRAALDRAQSAEAALSAANAELHRNEELSAAHLRDAKLHQENTERMAGLLREEVARAERAEGHLAEANARAEGAEARIMQYVHDAALHRGNAVDLAERYTRIERDHVGLAERHGKVVGEHTALAERCLRLEAEHADLAQRVHDAEMQVAEVRDEAASRVATMELELRAAAERQIKAADEYDRRLREIVVRFADQSVDALRASERHAADRAALSERLIASEREAARVAALAEHSQRLLSESENAVGAERERCASLARDVERAREELAELRTAVADRIAERDAAYDRLREARSEKEALIQQMGTILLDGPGQRAPAVDQGELDGLRSQVAAIRNSTSWRVTAPLRGVSRLLGRGRK